VLLDPDALLHDSMIQRIDPRVRIVMAVLFSVVVILVDRLAPFAVLMALVVAGFALIRIGVLALRLVPLNVLMLTVIATLPFSIPGDAIFLLGPLRYSFDGFWQAVYIALKGNAIVIMLTALIATIEPVHLGHALERLYVPRKLTLLFLFTVRYFAVLDREFNRLNRAMTLRGFRPRLTLHTLRTYAYLTGMLLVRALERSERIMDAMRCRGFDGRFRPIEPFQQRLALRDAAFCFLFVGCIAIAVARYYGR
jgi:cobalt/nickel transport system permease protein